MPLAAKRKVTVALAACIALVIAVGLSVWWFT